MASYRPIATVHDLPEPGTVKEHLHLDFKAYKGVGQPDREMAKDVASFANVSGGAVLVGASHEAGTLWEYSPLKPESASEVAEAYRRAAQRHCKPHPVTDTRLIKMGGGFIVAVNVPPYPAPPIGVRSQENGEAWLFPARRGDHTHYLLPEELSTIMDPVYRRKVLLVEQIPAREDGSRPAYMHFVDVAKLLYEKGARLGNEARIRPQYQMSIVEIDPYRGVLNARSDRPNIVVVPLDAVQSVWLDHSRPEYQIAIKGALAEEGGLLRFFPT